MAKRRKKAGSGRVKYIFGKGFRGRKSKGNGSDWKTMLTVFGTVIALAAVGYALIFLLSYAGRVNPVANKTGKLELIEPPAWLNEPLKKKILTAACSGGEDLKLDEDSARSVHNNIEKIAWLYDVKVQTTSKSFLISGSWRKPLTEIKSGLSTYYLDKDMVVLDYIPIDSLVTVEVTGYSGGGEALRIGQVLDRNDVRAAVKIIEKLGMMDAFVTADKPMLREIRRIDVSNYDGRKRRKDPHIVLYTKDDTQIQWGAEIGKWSQNLECGDKEKLDKLYSYYKERGTLLGGARYINLREPQNSVPLPIDRY